MKTSAARPVSPIPTLFTATNLALSSVGIALLFDRGVEGLVSAGILIVVAAVMDSFDGRIARATNSCTAFGMELDSMADLVSFGVAPAWLAYVFALSALGPIGIAVSIGWTLCVAWRLARFNANTQNSMGTYMGLPCPPAAAALAATIMLCAGSVPEGAQWDAWRREGAAPLTAAGMAVLAWLMVSRVAFVPVFKIGWFTPMLQLITAVGIIGTGLITGTFQRVLCAVLLLYVLSGPAAALLARLGLLPAAARRADRRLAGPRHHTATSKPNR